MKEQAQALARSVNTFKLADTAPGTRRTDPAPRPLPVVAVAPKPRSLPRTSPEDEWKEF
jgi:hypothetical protein